MKYVIIGNSTAAVGAVEAIRKTDQAGQIVIVGAEPYHTYSRPLISYWLAGKVTWDQMKYRGDDFYEAHRCVCRLGKRVTAIRPEQKQIVLDDDTTEEYDKLLVATGSSPVIPPIQGLGQVKNKFTFCKLDDAVALQEVLDEESRVLILGAGLIGLKCAEGIQRCKQIMCVDLSPKVLSSILDDESAEMIRAHLEAHQINFYLAHKIAAFSNPHTAVLDDGTQLAFDVLVLAVGVRPNASLIQEIGGKVNRGILIDEKCQTSIPDLYAAGDCCECRELTTGESKVLALLPNAYMQGECAGENMAGECGVFDKAIPMNAIGFFGLHMITAGTYRGNVYFDSDGKNYKKLFYSDDKLNGFILIGDVEKAGIYTALIREQTTLSTLDFELICKKPGLMAFEREARAEKLGGGAHDLQCV